MPRRDIVVVGASAGGVEALVSLVRELPADLPAALFVVLHVAADYKSVLPRILSGAGPLPAKHALDREAVLPGRIYVARPDHHLVLEDSVMRVVRGPKENGARPAIDALFRTAAWAYGARVVGVILSGALDDGTAGLVSIKQRGGLAIVQDPADAAVDQMPRSALENVDVDHILPVRDIGAQLAKIVREDAPGEADPPPAREMVKETRLALTGDPEPDMVVGHPSPLSCPDCGGVLNEVHDGDLIRFRCQVGHGYAPESLYGQSRMEFEHALWAALRALEEQATLSRRMAVRARELRQVKSAARFDDRAEEAASQARLVRQALQLGPVQNRTPRD